MDGDGEGDEADARVPASSGLLPAPVHTGTIGYFATEQDLLRFARTGQHRELMQWAVDGTRNATGGYIRLYAEPNGTGAAMDPGP